MSAPKPLEWRERLRRALHSLCDRAPRLAHGDHAGEPWCTACRESTALASASDFAAGMPHWFAHALAGVLTDIRVELTYEMLDHPIGDSTVGELILGIGNVPRASWSEDNATAHAYATEHHRLVDLWMREDLLTLKPWADRILAAGALIPRDLHPGIVFLDRLVLGEGTEPWREVCIEWARRLGSRSSEQAAASAVEPPETEQPETAPPAVGSPEVRLPEWLTDAQRMLVQESIDAVVERLLRRQRQKLIAVVRRIPDLRERDEEMRIVEVDLAQVRIERREELCAQLDAQHHDIAIALAAAAHAAVCGDPTIGFLHLLDPNTPGDG